MKRPVIAVVDDEEAVRVALLYLFLSEGLHALSFASGAEYFVFAETRQPDCVILDLQMPSITGWEILKRLEDIQAKPAIITISGNPHPYVAQGALAAGSSAHFQKPLEGSELLAIVYQTLDERREELSRVRTPIGFHI